MRRGEVKGEGPSDSYGAITPVWDDVSIGHIARREVTPAEAEQAMLNGPVARLVRIVTAFDSAEEDQAVYLSERG